MLRERGISQTNQTFNTFDNLPGRQHQPYITWKFKNENDIMMSNRFNSTYEGNDNKTKYMNVATNSRPISNLEGSSSSKTFIGTRHPSGIRTACNKDGNPNYLNGNFVKYTPNPIKHWRKQLIPYGNTVSKRVNVRQAMDIPGGMSMITKKEDTSCNCNSHNVPNYLINNYVNKNCEKNQNCQEDENGKHPMFNKARITRPASTIVKKNYYQTNSAYLRNRVKLHNQNQTLSQRKDNEYYENPDEHPLQVLPPDNSINRRTTGSQIFNSVYCNNLSCCNDRDCTTIIYKPSNSGFSNQGAVSSSLRTLNIKKNAVNKVAKSLKEDFGTSSRNNARYRGLDREPITRKTFNQEFTTERELLKDRKHCCYVQKRTTQNSRKQPPGAYGWHTVYLNINNYKILESLNGVRTVKNRVGTQNKSWAKGPILPREFECQTIKQALNNTRSLQNNRITYYKSCERNPKNEFTKTSNPRINIPTGGTILSASHR